MTVLTGNAVGDWAMCPVTGLKAGLLALPRATVAYGSAAPVSALAEPPLVQPAETLWGFMPRHLLFS